MEFDWTRILKGPPETQAEPQVERKRDAARSEIRPRAIEPPAVADSPGIEVAPALSGIDDVPADIPDIEAEIAPEPESTLTPSAALTRLGSEALLRLRARYAEVMARITERVVDPAQQEELKTKAERLNPDTWVTDDEVRAGLDLYEVTFEALRSVVGRPRKRRRRARRTHGRENASVSNSPLPTEEDGPQSLDAGDAADRVEDPHSPLGDERDDT